MKNLAISSAVVVVVGLGGSLILTNPSHTVYQKYATEQLSAYLKAETCDKAPNFLEGGCKDLIDSLQPQLIDLFARSTERHNFLFFSIYSTTIEPETISPLLPGGLPTYHFETLGIFNSFNTYKTEQS